MKKIYILALLISLFFRGYSQDNCVISCTGVRANFYSRCVRPEHGFGLVVTADTINSPLNNPDPKDQYPGFYAPYKYEDNELKFNISTTLGMYTPISFEFGTKTGKSGPDSMYTIDLSQNASFDILLKNYSNTNLRVRLSLQDINDSIVTNYSNTTVGDANKTIIEKPIEARGTLPAELRWTGTGNRSFENAVNVTYKYNPESGQTECDWILNPITISNKFDFTKVKRILITFLNASDSGPHCYSPESLENTVVSIKYIHLGSIVPVGYKINYDNQYIICTPINSVRKEYNNFTIQVSPNPASEEVSISYNVQSNATVTIYDIMGALVKSAQGDNNKTIINTSDVKSGIYFLSVEADGNVFKGEKLIIK